VWHENEPTKHNTSGGSLAIKKSLRPDYQSLLVIINQVSGTPGALRMKTNKLIPLKYSQALQGFFLTQQSRRLSPHPIADYTVTLNRFKIFLERDYQFQEITARHIENFLAQQTHLSKKTLLNYYTGLSALWTWAVKERIAESHIVRELEPPKPEIRQIMPYSETEVRSMLTSLERSKRYKRKGKRISDHAVPYAERNRAIILLLLDTGIRAEELCLIKVHQLDKRNQRIKIFGKGAKERYVNFSARTHQAIWRYLTTREGLKDDDYLFIVDTGRKFRRDRLLDLLQTIGARAGVTSVTVHRFRHTFAIQYLRNRGDPYTLQKMLGHSTLEMIKRYLAIAQSDVEAAHRLASPVDNWAL
jgi:integrase/recombinase XerD